MATENNILPKNLTTKKKKKNKNKEKLTYITISQGDHANGKRRLRVVSLQAMG